MKLRKLEKGERGFIIVNSIAALICIIASAKIFFKNPILSSDGTMPLLVSVVFFLMTLVMLFEIRKFPSGFSQGENTFKSTIEFLFPGKVGLIILYCVLYAVLLNWAGFIVSTFLLLSVSMITLKSEKKLHSCIISAGTLAVIMVLFQFIFKVRLP